MVRESCREYFGELRLLTLSCLYIFEVIVYCRSRCTLIRGRTFINIKLEAGTTFELIDAD
ncbi:hypothetical protein J6590_040025 [Homalodisca vitripennis]|nr:hypothetical protein J6590_040025 [Homalodisca vitripennis]